MNADGSGQRNLTRSPRATRRLVTRRTEDRLRAARRPEIYVMNADGSGQRNLTRSPWHEGSASWSPAQKK